MRFQYTKRFCQDYTRAAKRGKILGKLDEIMDCVIQEKPLPPRCCDHELVGNYKGIRECHIEPDWLLLYYRKDTAVVFVATGTHSDLFR